MAEMRGCASNGNVAARIAFTLAESLQGREHATPMNSLRLLLLAVASVLTASCGVTNNPEARPLAKLGMATHSSLPSHFKLLNWNIYKGKRPDFVSQYEKLSADTALVTLQEMSTRLRKESGTGPLDAVLKHPGFGLQLVDVLKYKDGFAGVATGSTARPISIISMPSPEPEHGVSWRKSSIITTYRLDGSRQLLMVANTHGLNLAGKAIFSQSRFDKQVQEVADVLAQHRGPLIWAGDFNTHDAAKTTALKKQTDRLGLIRVPVKNSELLMHSHLAKLELDHVYVRGLKWISAEAKRSEGSDHAPMVLVLTPQ